MNLVQAFFNEKITKTGSSRLIANTNNLKTNSFLFDVKFKAPADLKEGDLRDSHVFDFLKDVYVTIALRLGSGNGSAVNIVSSCPAFLLLQFSDFVAGVSMESPKVKDGYIRVSGALPIGFFSMGSRDSLDCIVNVASSDKLPEDGFQLTISNVYNFDTNVSIRTYQCTKPTGASQPYTNVLGVYYSGDKVLNKEAVIQDQLNTMNTGIEDGMALANSVGHFEVFTRFAKLYEDPFSVSQNVNFKIPADDTEAQVLIVGYHFDTALLVSNAGESDALKANLLSIVKKDDTEKYEYLQALGLVKE